MRLSARVLVVDDDANIREAVELALSDEGYEVVGAPDGAAALDLASQSPPALILLDLRMPVMDGSAFVRAYRQRPGPHALIVVLTAAYNAAVGAAELQADGYLEKPFGLDELLETVGRYTRRA